MPAESEHLPLDSDLDVDETATGEPRPIHLSWRYLGLVAVGGSVGTGLREAFSLAVPSMNGVGWVIVAVNVAGALALGLLLEGLARGGPDIGRRRTVRLLVGTGLLGGFTTYSTLATAAATLLLGKQVWLAVSYGIGTVVLGAGASAAGIAIATALHGRRQSRTPAGQVRRN